jgi:hypothetical protein
MSIFSKVLEKLGLKKTEDKEEAPVKGTMAAKGAPARPVAPKRAGISSAAADRLAQKRAMLEAKRKETKEASLVDVMSKLETMAEGTNLKWKVSIVDLLKVLGIDSSLDARKELAKELGCPTELIGGDYAEMNVWLHKAVLLEVAENGGNVPLSMLD